MRGAAVLLCAILSVLSAARAAEAPVTGIWYEEAVYGGSRYISIMRLDPDGSYSATHRKCLKQGSLDDHETGHWQYKDGIVHIITDTVDGVPSGAVNDYRTESNNGHIWVYVGIAGPGFARYGPVRFRDVHVAKDSELPKCDLTS